MNCPVCLRGFATDPVYAAVGAHPGGSFATQYHALLRRFLEIGCHAVRRLHISDEAGL